MLYCTSVVLSGKLFRMKPYLWLNSFSFNLLYKSKSSQLVYSLRRWRFYLLSLHSGMPYERWAMLPFILPWLNHTWVRSFYRRITHEYFSVRPYPAWHVVCISLKSAWVEPSSAAVTEFTLILLRISPYWLHLLSTNYSNIWNSN